MNQNPLVSIIIPCYNAESYIQRSLNSAISQNYRNIEVICVDNNSTDNTCEILKEFSVKNPNVKLYSESRKGACFARNFGLSVAKGEWIQFLDADDEILPDKIKHQIELLATSVCTQSSSLFIAGNEYWIRDSGEKIEFHKFKYNCWIDLIEGTLGDTCSNLWSRKGLEAINGWDNNLNSSQELDLMFRLLKSGAGVIYDPVINTHTYQQSSNSISSGNQLQNTLRALDLRILIGIYLKSHSMLDAAKDSLYFALLTRLETIYGLSRKDFRERYKVCKLHGFQLLRCKKLSLSKRMLLRTFGLQKFLLLKYRS